MRWDSRRIVHDLGRLYEIASVFIQFGFGDLVHRLDLGKYLQKAGKVLEWKQAEEYWNLTPPERFRKALESLGPTFVKLGQIMASRVDMFKPEWIRELEKLQNHAPPVSFEELRPQMEEDLGAAPEDIFVELETEPIGSASIAQVHRAKLVDGTPVVLKVRRPGIRPKVESDLRLLTYVAEMAEKNSNELRIYRPVELMHQFTTAIRHELDLAIECRNAERVAENIRGNDVVVIPKVYWQWTTERLNVQELIEGIPGYDLEAVDRAQMDRKYIARHGSAIVIKMIIEDGLFHADPHPGNIIFLPNNRIAFIDWGMVGRMPEKRRHQVVDLLFGLVNRDAETAVELIIEWSDAQHVDAEKLTYEVEITLDKYHGANLQRIDIANLFSDITRLLHKYKLTLPPDLAMMLKVFVTLEGFGRQLDPDFDLAHEAKPILQKALIERYSPKAIAKRMQGLIGEIFDLATGLPKDVRRLLKAMKEGSLRAQIEILYLKELTDRLDRASSRLSASFVTAALIVGTSVVVASERGPTILGFPLFHIFGMCAFVGGVWVLYSIWRHR